MTSPYISRAKPCAQVVMVFAALAESACSIFCKSAVKRWALSWCLKPRSMPTPTLARSTKPTWSLPVMALTPKCVRALQRPTSPTSTNENVVLCGWVRANCLMRSLLPWKKQNTAGSKRTPINTMVTLLPSLWKRQSLCGKRQVLKP